MRTWIPAAISLLLASCATPQQAPPPEAGPPPQSIVPPSAAPNTMPPAPPMSPPPPSTAQAQPPPSGQWVYTSQYGWVWMPYGEQYIYFPAEVEAYPSEYVFVFGAGWQWVGAPWIWGVGPHPWWGPYGPWRYHWYRGPQMSPPPGHWGGRRR